MKNNGVHFYKLTPILFTILIAIEPPARAEGLGPQISLGPQIVHFRQSNSDYVTGVGLAAGILFDGPWSWMMFNPFFGIQGIKRRTDSKSDTVLQVGFEPFLLLPNRLFFAPGAGGASLLDQTSSFWSLSMGWCPSCTVYGKYSGVIDWTDWIQKIFVRYSRINVNQSISRIELGVSFDL